MAGTPLSAPDTAKDVGIILNKKLTFEDYIECITKKSRKRIGVLFRAFSCRDLKFMRLAYVTFTKLLSPY